MAEVRDAADGGSGWTAPADGSKRMKAEADLKTAPKHQSRGGGQDAVAAPDSLLAALRAVLMQLTCGQHSRFVMLWPTPLAARHGPGSALLHIQQRCTGRCCLEGPGRTSSCGGGLNARRHGSGSVCCPTPLLLCQRAATCSHRPYPPSALCCQVAVRRMQSFSPQPSPSWYTSTATTGSHASVQGSSSGGGFGGSSAGGNSTAPTTGSRPAGILGISKGGSHVDSARCDLGAHSPGTLGASPRQKGWAEAACQCRDHQP